MLKVITLIALVAGILIEGSTGQPSVSYSSESSSSSSSDSSSLSDSSVSYTEVKSQPSGSYSSQYSSSLSDSSSSSSSSSSDSSVSYTEVTSGARKPCSCPPKCTRPNEIYDPCDAPCPERTCAFDVTLSLCMKPPQVGDKACVIGCRCKDGYLRNDKGVCVPRDQCPQKCKKNEYWDTCPDCRPQNCSTIGQSYPPCPPVCIPACRCNKGYARDNNGDCVPVDYCSKCPKPDEVYEPCPDCSPQTCETRNKTFHCPKIPADPCDPGCKPACRCKRGFFRNKINECISAENCGKCPGPHEYWSCGPACDNRCDSEYGQDNCDIQNVKCNEMCYCEKDYARATNGTCIPKEDCEYECPKNEEYNDCPDALCTAKKCSEAGFPLNYMGLNDGEPCPGEPGCVCKHGFLRDCNGVCVPVKECPSCGGDSNGMPGCGTNCRKQCADLNRTEPIDCVLMCYPNGCECRDGYFYDANKKKCVLPCDCSPVCKEDEVYSPCVNNCENRYCSDLNRLDEVCVEPLICKDGCVCAAGYLRNKDGKCVPIEKCDHCPKNERFYKCPDHFCASKKCTDAGHPLDCIGKYKDTDPCPGKHGCICDIGYLRDCDGVCIPSKDCSSCGGDKNATLGCGNHCGNTCSDYNKNPPSECPTACVVNMCDCRPGYVYDENTKECVLPCDCVYCGLNEIFDICDASCPSRTCDFDPTVVKCSPPPKPGSPNCVIGCRCKDGYLRNAKGICIPEKECPPKCDKNEHWDPCPDCNPQTCKTIDKILPCPKGPCKGSCRCDEGFVRDKNNKCVPKHVCYKCPDNEEYNKCPAAVCIAKKCSDLGYQLNCTTVKDGDPCPGDPGCICKSGFLRDCNGKCIPLKDCPSCRGDRNATQGCGTYCRKRCSDYNSKIPIDCPPGCQQNGCDCRDGYYYDTNLKKCVLPCDCIFCGENEVYDPCDAPCPWRTCDFDPTVVKCSPPPKPGSSNCVIGCRCKDGYLRNAKGICIPEKECPPKCDKNEHWDPCPDCNPQTCKTIDKILPCPKGPCKGSCRCDEGFVRDKNNKCVPKDVCYKCPDNEEYNKCPAAVCIAKKCSDLGYPLNCTTVKDGDPCPGDPGCICKSGFLRDCNGKCIPLKDCPSCRGDRNATQGCDTYCRKRCSDYNSKIPIDCSPGCQQNGCECRDGYYYDSNLKKCVLPCDCTPKCKTNEFWDPCPDCNPQTCCTLDKPMPCPKGTCKGACRCKKGFVRDNNGNCVSTDICKKCPKNEHYEKCPAALCLAKKCSELGYPLNCTSVKDCDPCPGGPGCICNKGFLRNCKGVCIPVEDCPSCKGDRNATLGCNTNCNRLCSNYNKKPGPCPVGCVQNGCKCRADYVYDSNTKQCVLPCDCTPVCKKNEVYSKCANGVCKIYCTDKTKPDSCVLPKKCKGGCVCAEGYLRNSKEVCIPINECPKCGCS